MHSIEGYRVAACFRCCQCAADNVGFWILPASRDDWQVRCATSEQSQLYRSATRSTLLSHGNTRPSLFRAISPAHGAKTMRVGLDYILSMVAGTYLQRPQLNDMGNAANITTGTVNCVTTASAFHITGVVVLPGIEAPSAARSALIMRPYDQELVTCKRYWVQNGIPERREIYCCGSGVAILTSTG